jgi:hypothetical protein
MSRHVTTMTIDDAPHISPERREEIIASYAPHERDARTRGIPSMGAGAIYPVAEQDIVCAPFAIPAHWKRGYGLDVGWNMTAAAWMAENPDDGMRYVYAEYYKGEALPVIHGAAIKARGEWIRGAIDPAARGRQQGDGRQLLADYIGAGLHLTVADNSVESGIYDLWGRMEMGRIKVFTTCTKLLEERRLYHRDEHGRVKKARDHGLDAWRYVNNTWDKVARTKPFERMTATAVGPADQRAGY